MKVYMDKIQFENRSEIDEVVSALDMFTEEHPNAREKQTAKRLKDLLDVMYISW